MRVAPAPISPSCRLSGISPRVCRRAVPPPTARRPRRRRGAPGLHYRERAGSRGPFHFRAARREQRLRLRGRRRSGRISVNRRGGSGRTRAARQHSTAGRAAVFHRPEWCPDSRSAVALRSPIARRTAGCRSGVGSSTQGRRKPRGTLRPSAGMSQPAVLASLLLDSRNAATLGRNPVTLGWNDAIHLAEMSLGSSIKARAERVTGMSERPDTIAHRCPAPSTATARRKHANARSQCPTASLVISPYIRHISFCQPAVNAASQARRVTPTASGARGQTNNSRSLQTPARRGATLSERRAHQPARDVQIQRAMLPARLVEAGVADSPLCACTAR